MSTTKDGDAGAATSSIDERHAAVHDYLRRFEVALAEGRVGMSLDGFLTMLELVQHLQTEDGRKIHASHRESIERLTDQYVLAMLERLDLDQDLTSHDIGRMAALAQTCEDPAVKAAVHQLCDDFVGVALAGVGAGQAPLEPVVLRGVADLAALIHPAHR